MTFLEILVPAKSSSNLKNLLQTMATTWMILGLLTTKKQVNQLGMMKTPGLTCQRIRTLLLQLVKTQVKCRTRLRNPNKIKINSRWALIIVISLILRNLSTNLSYCVLETSMLQYHRQSWTYLRVNLRETLNLGISLLPETQTSYIWSMLFYKLSDWLFIIQ